MTTFEGAEHSGSAMPRPVLIRGGAPYGEDPADVLVVDGRIAAVGGDGAGHADADDAIVLDATGMVILPGLVDVHTHLREPGGEDAETVASGSAAAARGGYTAVCAMPNTEPAADTAGVAEQVLRLGRDTGLVDVQPIGAVTVGRRGEQLAELAAMNASAARVTMFSDDGSCVADPLLMRRALEYVKAFGGVIAQHAQEPRLTVGAQMHEGVVSAELGLAGWPAVAEEAIVARDCLLTEQVGSRLHVCHLSTEGSVALVSAAKQRGASVTAEVTPHHLLLTDERARSYDPVNKVNPPLRPQHHVDAVRRALANGVIDVVATDHAPHARQAKETAWAEAKPGMLGLQTALAVVAEAMVSTELMTWREVARVMSERPAEIAGLAHHGRPIAVGQPANLTVIDPKAAWTVRPDDLVSLSANNPYVGHKFSASVAWTLLRGRITAGEEKS